MALFYGDSGNNGINGKTRADLIFGFRGNDTVAGGVGDDTLYGNRDFDRLDGGAGNDFLDGGSQNDTLRGDAGNDFLIGQVGNDVLDGGEGNDLLEGAGDADLLDGGAGNDLLSGSEGTDTLAGGAGKDTLFGGGEDGDTFRFAANDGRKDVIVDFSHDDNDVIDLSEAFAGTLTFIGKAAAFATAGEVRYVESKDGLVVHVNLDQDKTPEVSFKLIRAEALVEADFLL